MPVHSAVAAVGETTPAWVRDLPGAEVFGVSPTAVEAGLNDALARTGAPFFLAVAGEDRIDPAGVEALAAALEQAPPPVMAATGHADQVRRDGSLRRTEAVALNSPRELLTLPRIPTPILFRTEALRAAGGWRDREACWEHRARRHRGLLARLLERGRLIAVHACLGTVAHNRGPAASPGEAAPTEPGALLNALLYRRVEVSAGPLRQTGRIAAVSPDLLTLATGGEQVMLIPINRITAVSPLAGEAPLSRELPDQTDFAEIPPVLLHGHLDPDRLQHHLHTLGRMQANPGGKQVTRVHTDPNPSWPSQALGGASPYRSYRSLLR